jgi:hypothetical protein
MDMPTQSLSIKSRQWTGSLLQQIHIQLKINMYKSLKKQNPTDPKVPAGLSVCFLWTGLTGPACFFEEILLCFAEASRKQAGSASYSGKPYGASPFIPEETLVHPALRGRSIRWLLNQRYRCFTVRSMRLVIRKHDLRQPEKYDKP